MSAESAFVPYRSLLQQMSPNNVRTGSTPQEGAPNLHKDTPADASSPIAYGSPTVSPIKASASAGHFTMGGSPGGTETDSLADITVATGGNMASDQRFKRLSKQLQRSYQEKHLLLTEIQVMKDQLRQWHREKGKDKLKSADGPHIAPMPGEEDAAWFTLLDLNERTNALALYYLYKGYAFKATLKAFRKWSHNAGGGNFNSSNKSSINMNTSGSYDPTLSTFERRRIELLEMAASVTAATSSLTSRSFDGILKTRSGNQSESDNKRFDRGQTRSASPLGRGQRSRQSDHQAQADAAQGNRGNSGRDDDQDMHRTLFPEDESVANSDAEYYYYDASGRHSSREKRSNRTRQPARSQPHNVPKLNLEQSQKPRGRQPSTAANNNSAVHSSLTAPTLTSHLRKMPFHGGNNARANKLNPQRQPNRGAMHGHPGSRSRGQNPPSEPRKGRDPAEGVSQRQRSPSISSVRSGAGVHMTNAALARAQFIKDSNKDQPMYPYAPERVARQAERRPSRGRSADMYAPPAEDRRGHYGHYGHGESNGYRDAQPEHQSYGQLYDDDSKDGRYNSIDHSRRDSGKKDRKSFSDGMSRQPERPVSEGRMQASFPRTKSESPQRSRVSVSGGKSFLNTSGVSIPPLPALQRDAHHVVLPLSPPDTDRSTVDGDTSFEQHKDNKGNNDKKSSPPPLPFSSDGLRLQKQREQKLEEKSIADIIASFGMAEKVPNLSASSLSGMPSQPAAPMTGGTNSRKPGNSSGNSNNAAPSAATQRWGIDMRPLDPTKPALANLRAVAGLPDLPSAQGGSAPAYPSTPGGAKRRAEIAMSIIHSMAAVGDTIADGARAGSSRGGSYSSNHNSKTTKSAFRS